MLLWLLLTCANPVPSEPIDIGPLLDTTLSYIAKPPYESYSGDFCFEATSEGEFYIYEPEGTWVYEWVEDDINVYHVLEDSDVFMEVQVLDYYNGVYELKLKQGLLATTVHTTDCNL